MLFWTYIVTAFRTAERGIGAGALSLLHSSQPPMEAVLATLLNDVQAIENDVVLVLDDYHVNVARDVQDGMAFLLEHLPAQIHLVIAGGADLADLSFAGKKFQDIRTSLNKTAKEGIHTQWVSYPEAPLAGHCRSNPRHRLLTARLP